MVTLSSSSLAGALWDLVERRVEPSAGQWFGQTLAATDLETNRGALLEAFTAVACRLGKGPLQLSEEERRRVVVAGLTWPIWPWRLDELGRVALLVTAAARWPEPEVEVLVAECYHRGDNRERQAVLRALALLPTPERFLAIGVDACRSHVQPLFEAIACENPYPARHFPELNFNQMVLKVLFTGVALDRVVGLQARVTPELQRMAADYASERRAAGRSIPPDIWRLIGERGHQP